MIDDELRTRLAAVGSDGCVDTLVCVRGLGWATASEVAGDMGTHVATAVKRLNAIHEAGFLQRRIRTGRTRHAKEYSLRSERFVIEVDLNDEKPAGAVLGALLRDILARLGRFGGRDEKEILDDWKNVRGMDEGVIAWLGAVDRKTNDAGPGKSAESIAAVLDAESARYGVQAMRALARASLDAVACGAVPPGLPSKYFGGE